MRQIRDDLAKHVGGTPTAAQAVLIDRCAWLSLRIALLDRKLASGCDFTEVDSNVYLAWSNSLTRTLARLGLDPPTPPRPKLTDILAEAAE